MTAGSARLLVLGTGGVLAASALVGKGSVLRTLGGEPTSGGGTSDRYQRLWSVGVVVLALSLVADLAPDLVGPFAILVFFGWYLSGTRAQAAATSPSAYFNTATR